MESKQIFVTIGISAITTIVVWTILTFTVGQTMLSPQQRGVGNENLMSEPSAEPSPLFNAHACRADRVCEVNSLEARNYSEVHGARVSAVNNLHAAGIEISAEQSVEKNGVLLPETKKTILSSGALSMTGNKSEDGRWKMGNLHLYYDGLTMERMDSTEQTARKLNLSPLFFIMSNPNFFLSLTPEEVKIEYLGEENGGSAYVCVNADGVLFRSQTPCV